MRRGFQLVLVGAGEKEFIVLFLQLNTGSRVFKVIALDDLLLRLLNGVQDLGDLNLGHHVETVVGHILYSDAPDSSSGSVRLRSSPRIEPDRIRTGFTRRTGSIRVPDTPMAGGLAGSGSVAVDRGSADFFLCNAGITRCVISSTIVSMTASSATVTAARTCSASITAMNGAARLVGCAGPALVGG